MGELRQLGVPFKIDKYERNLVFNLIVQDKCKDRYGELDDLFKIAADINETVWLATQMLNEDAEIWNEDHPEDKKPTVDELKVKRGIDGFGGIRDLQDAVSAAILKGTPEEMRTELEEMGKNLIAAQSGKTMNRAQRRAKK